VQTGKRNPMPLVLVDDPDRPYWPHLIRFLEEELLSRNFICPSDFALFERVCSVEAAVEKIRHFYRRYHSLRFVHGQLVIRLTSELSPDDIRKLTDQFHDILLPGGRIAASGALDAEREDTDVLHLPRLVIDFNRKGFGRLRSLIDSINDF
jgi:hypothetical protein